MINLTSDLKKQKRTAGQYSMQVDTLKNELQARSFGKTSQGFLFAFGQNFRTAACGHDYSPINLSQTLQIQLRDKTQENVRDKQRIENQKTELKNLNSKSHQVASLNNEVNKLKAKLAKTSDIEQYKMQISHLEANIRTGTQA